MMMIEMTTQLTFDQLLASLNQLNAADLSRLTDHITKLQQRMIEIEIEPEQAISPFEQFAGVLEGVITTDELMTMTRGDE